MPRRYEDLLGPTSLPLRPAVALRTTLRRGYSRDSLRADFLGLQVAKMPETYLERVAALGRALPSFHWPDLVVGAVTLALLLLWPKLTKKVPAPLVALSLAGLAAALATNLGEGSFSFSQRPHSSVQRLRRTVR